MTYRLQGLCQFHRNSDSHPNEGGVASPGVRRDLPRIPSAGGNPDSLANHARVLPIWSTPRMVLLSSSSVNVTPKFTAGIVHSRSVGLVSLLFPRVIGSKWFDDLTQFPDAHNFISHPDVSLSEDHLGLAGLVTLRKAPRAKG